MELINRLLYEAVSGESQAEKRYLLFAEQALNDGLAGIATLFVGLSRAESIHIANHRKALEKNQFEWHGVAVDQAMVIGATLENIDSAIQGETEEITSMYPSFCKQIKKKHGREFTAKIALLSMKWAMEAEKGHLELLKAARKKVAAAEDFDTSRFYLCAVCGNLVYEEEKPGKNCPVCGHDAKFYQHVRM